MSKRYTQPIPFGWYFVGFTKELKAGDVKPLHYFGKELVLFRTESGAAKLLDAHCPHLGAHLGYGGKVKGESIACPFHGWQFNGGGQCTAVPYANNMPPKVAGGKEVIHAYPVVERNAVIWAWYHPEHKAPTFDVIELPEFSAPDWTEVVPSACEMWKINTIIQEAGENAVDVAHFFYLHNAQEWPSGTTEWNGPVRDSKYVTVVPAINADGTLDTTSGATYEQRLNAISCGPGQTIQRFTGAIETILQGLSTPIDDQNIELRFIYTQPKNLSHGQQMLAKGVLFNVSDQVLNDIPVWEHKVYQENPILCDGDGPIHQYRKWFQQFYAGPDKPALRAAS